MIKTEIGEFAGYIWHYLDKNGETLISKVKEDITKQYAMSDIFFYMAIGWLSRENNINVTADKEKFDNSNIKIKLR